MSIQKVPGRGIVIENVDSSNIKNHTLLGEDLALGTITGSNIAQGTIDASNIKPGTFGDMKTAEFDADQDGKVDNAETADSVAWTGITGKPTTLSGYGIPQITNADISNTAAIDTAKIDWGTSTFQNLIQPSLQLPPGIFFQNYDIDNIMDHTSVNDRKYAFVNNFYLPFPLTVNYFIYILVSGGSSYRTRAALYDVDGQKIWDSGNQSAAANTYKIPVPALQLTPNVYYVMFATNDAPTRFLSIFGGRYAVVPQKGYYTIGTTWPSAMPSNLPPSSITVNGATQPWFALSKY